MRRCNSELEVELRCDNQLVHFFLCVKEKADACLHQQYTQKEGWTQDDFVVDVTVENRLRHACLEVHIHEQLAERNDEHDCVNPVPTPDHIRRLKVN
jgi:hypothetical protein